MRIHSLTVGPFQSNCHIAACEETGKAVIFDACDEAARILDVVERERRGLGTCLLVGGQKNPAAKRRLKGV